MSTMLTRVFPIILLVTAACGGPAPAPSPAAQPASTAAATADPLPSWNEGASKRAIRDFVTGVTGRWIRTLSPSPSGLPTFDNDGTLWSEKPLPFQVLFAIDPREGPGAAASRMDETRQPFASVLKGDMAGVMARRREGQYCRLSRRRMPG